VIEDALYESISPSDLWSVEIAAGLPQEKAQALADSLEDMAVSVYLHNADPANDDRWDVRLTVAGKPDAGALKAAVGDIPFTVAPVQQKDWLKAVHENFPPLTIGKFFIYGSHVADTPPPDLLPLRIDAATAFGSGEHPTTQGCLLALENLAQDYRFANGLDMGCGSGILAVAMARLWPGMKIAAVDIDPESTRMTKHHAALNGVQDRIAAETGDGYDAPLARTRAPYDLITANILAGPLIGMAGNLDAVLKVGGFCVLSGLLARQMEDVAAAHMARGLELALRLPMGDWDALVFRKPGPVLPAGKGV
jgi:ribosomal protein L11 methyltransferase